MGDERVEETPQQPYAPPEPHQESPSPDAGITADAIREAVAGALHDVSVEVIDPMRKQLDEAARLITELAGRVKELEARPSAADAVRGVEELNRRVSNVLAAVSRATGADIRV